MLDLCSFFEKKEKEKFWLECELQRDRYHLAMIMNNRLLRLDNDGVWKVDYIDINTLTILKTKRLEEIPLPPAPLLTTEEKKYLIEVLKWDIDEVECITKNEDGEEYEYIAITMKDGDNGILPHFKTGTRFKNLDKEKAYTPDQLDIW